MEKEIIVALGFDDQKNDVLMKWGEIIASRYGLPLHLVHSYRSFDSVSIPISGMEVPTYQNELINEEIEDSVRWMERRRINDWAKTVDGKVDVSTHYINGGVSELIHYVSENCHPELFIVGLPGEAHTLRPAELSFGLKTIKELNMPILAIPLDAEINFPERPVLLIADDLRKNRNMIASSIQFIDQIGGGTVINLHIQGLSMWQRIVEKFQEMRSGESAKLSRDVIKDGANLKKQMDKKMKALLSGLRHSNPISKKSMILRGGVLTGILKSIKRTNASLLAIKKHRLFHSEDYRFGALPLKKLSRIKVPILISP